MIAKTKRYTTSTANAEWIKCDHCGGQAAVSINVECSGGHGRKGSRHLSYACERCMGPELERLRKRK